MARRVASDIALSCSTVPPAIPSPPPRTPPNLKGIPPGTLVRRFPDAKGRVSASSCPIHPLGLPVEAAVLALRVLVWALCGVAPSPLAKAIKLSEVSTMATEIAIPTFSAS